VVQWVKEATSLLCSVLFGATKWQVTKGGKMSALLDTFVAKLSWLAASVWSQLCVSPCFGFGSEVEPIASDEQMSDESAHQSSGEIRAMDDYAGYLTTNGLGSLDIGGGNSHWRE